MTNILALDLGTQLGWALYSRGVITHGSTSFHVRRAEGPGHRWLKYRAHLAGLGQDADIGAIYYEDVKRHGPGVLAAHVYGGLLAHLELWAEVNRIPLHPVGVGTVKKSWTGKGNADKAMMIAEAVRRGFKPVDDNAADALAILALARAAEGDVPPPLAEKSIDEAPASAPAEAWDGPF